MIFKSTKLNMITLLRAVGYMKTEQIMRFFSDADDAQNIPFYIKQQVDEKNFLYDKSRDILQFRRAEPIKSDVVLKRIRALWVLSAFGSSDVRQVFLIPYPGEYMFITSDDRCYDVICVDNNTIAQLAMYNRTKFLPKDMPDEVNHIAVVGNADFGRRLDAYQFDSYCTLDGEHNPQYFVWEADDEL